MTWLTVAVMLAGVYMRDRGREARSIVLYNVGTLAMVWGTLLGLHALAVLFG